MADFAPPPSATRSLNRIKVFDPIRIFRGGMMSAIPMAAFYLLNISLLALRKQTSAVMAIFKRAQGRAWASARTRAGDNSFGREQRTKAVSCD
jgi:hypothetical protein